MAQDLVMIIDGSSLLYRAFFALPPLSTKSGIETGAVHGFMNMLLRLLDEKQPAAVAVAFDKSRITFRNGVYDAYKAHRKPTPPELSSQFPLVMELLAAMGIPAIELEGYEADDIIGTLAARYAAQQKKVLVVTGDKDALQLIRNGVDVLLTKKGISELELYDEEQFFARYHLKPAQMIDLKGLMGDTSDNIPGVPGVGEKTALKLLHQYGSVEALLEAAHEVNGKLGEKLREHAEQARLSKKLATIELAVPLESQQAAAPPNLQREALRQLCQSLELRSIWARLEKKLPDAPPVEAATCASEIENVDTEADFAALALDWSADAPLICLPEAEGACPQVTFLALVFLAGKRAVRVTVGTPAWPSVARLLASPHTPKWTHDAKELLHACESVGIECANIAFDTAVAAYLLDAGTDLSLPNLAEQYAPQWVSQQPVCQLAALQPVLWQALSEREQLDLFGQIELPLVPVLAAMERAGIALDMGKVAALRQEIGGRIEVLAGQITELAGEAFNINSTKQLGQILFEKLGLPVVKKTKTGYSTDAEVLENLKEAHPIVEKLLEYRMLAKLDSTYLQGMVGLVRPETGRVHTHYQQLVTTTGRLSSTDPNLQNIPVRTPIGKRIRSLFVPGSAYDELLSFDYSQVELRILAHMSQDEALIDAFLQKQDIHARTAAQVFDVPLAEVTSEMRRRAKAVNFGIVYGISDYGLSRDLGISRKEAQQYIDRYFERYPGVKKFMDDCIESARRDGYARTMFGRRRYLPDINSKQFNRRGFAERTAINTPIQGTAADIMKKAMIAAQAALLAHKLKSRLLLQVHDELVLEAVHAEKALVVELVAQAMTGAAELSVPLVVDVGGGPNWAAAKD